LVYNSANAAAAADDDDNDDETEKQFGYEQLM
jgi:hypothetical protein